MIHLAIDTAADRCAVCLWDAGNNKVIASQTIEQTRGHAETIIPLVDSVLADAKMDLEVVTKIGVCIGPGSFTGIRVGVSVARGFGVAMDIPVVGLSVFDGMGHEIRRMQKEPVAFSIAITGGRGQAFAQSFDGHGNARAEPFIVQLDEPDDRNLHGSKIIYGSAALQIDSARASADFCASTADIKAYACLIASCAADPKPLYIRAADAKINEGFALPRSEAITS